METMQRILMDATREALKDARSWPEERRRDMASLGLDIEERIMGFVKARITLANSIASKGEPRMRMPVRLNAWQIATILADVLSLEKPPGACRGEGYTGIWPEDKNQERVPVSREELARAVLCLDMKAGTAAQSSVFHMLDTLCPEAGGPAP